MVQIWGPRGKQLFMKDKRCDFFFVLFVNLFPRSRGASPTSKTSCEHFVLGSMLLWFMLCIPEYCVIERGPLLNSVPGNLIFGAAPDRNHLAVLVRLY